MEEEMKEINFTSITIMKKAQKIKFCLIIAFLDGKIPTDIPKMKMSIHSKYFQLLIVNP